MKQIKIFLYLFLLFPVIAYAQADSNSRDKAIEETLYAMEKELQSPIENFRQIDIENEGNNFGQSVKGNIRWPASDTYLTLGLEFGYLKGYTAYDFNHHTSELEFPMDNVMIGSNFSFGLKNLSFNTEFWTPLESDAGFNMKDKDWTTSGVLYSYTKSKANMDAIIWDANLRCDFYKVDNWTSEYWPSVKFDEIKIGALLGYKYERFDYDMYDLFYQVDLLYGYQGQTLYGGQRVLTYKIKYYLPYLGLAADFLRENLGFGMNIKGSFFATAEDVDNHLLRGLTFYGDYHKHGQGLICSIYAFWKFIKDWKLKAGADGTFISIDGTTWEEKRDPGWDKDQTTDTRQWMFWSGIEYKF